MNNRELAEKLDTAIREERKITNEVLRLINLALEQRAYLELGYPSMFEWLTRGFGYSNAAAYRRIEAARLLRSVPEAVEKLESGHLNLTTLSKVQSAIRAQEKSGGKVSLETKRNLVKKIENKTELQAEQIALNALPAAASHIHQDRKHVINDHTVRRSMNMTNHQSNYLDRAKQLLSHKYPNASDGEIVAYALQFLIEHLESKSMTQTASAPEAIRVRNQNGNSSETSKSISSAAAKRITFHESQGRCTYKDPITGKICGSQYQVQFDHILPRARGGTNEPGNLRLRCRQHNLLEAEKIFGRRHMDKFRRKEN